MQLHNLQRVHSNKSQKRIGRGGKRGTTAGRGTKGQHAHGGTPRPEIRDFIKKLPKQRGYKFNSVQEKAQGVNLAALEASFEKGETVSPQTLLNSKLVRRASGKLPRVKILGNGELSKALTFERVEFSASAKEKVEKAGGTIK